ETELTPEERLLRAIFGEKAREVRDTSLKVPHGESGSQKNYRNCTIEQMHCAHNMNANHPFTSLPELFISFYSGVPNCMRYSKRFFLSAFAASSMFLACNLPLSPSSAPPTMRAISEILPSSESCLTVEPVRSPSTVFSTRYC
ncbi:MAG: hypothetical protein IJB99_01535, partial [Clostridia bacterium]|nr:hypothetical protein [Clostridia bacterium]